MYTKRLEELRLKRQLTKRDIAKAFSVSESTYGKWELGHRKPCLETLDALAGYYGVSTDFLLGKTEDPTPADAKKPPYAQPKSEKRKSIDAILDALPDEEMGQILRVLRALIREDEETRQK